MAELDDYLHAVWGECRKDAYIEVSARVNGAAGGGAGGGEKIKWRTQHVRLGDLLDGGEKVTDGLRELSRGEGRIDLYLGCMPLSEAPETGRGKGILRESVPGVWFDIDAQAPGRMVSAKKTPDHPHGQPLFETPEAALAALDEFCDERQLRAGVITHSGWGLHAWILCTEPLGADGIEIVRHWNVEFADWASRRYGVHVDVVSDRTRVLRAPETVNWRKADNLDEAVEVRVLRLETEMRFTRQQLGWDQAFENALEARRRATAERESRGYVGTALEDCALFDARCALDACSWGEILVPEGWERSEPEGSGELERWSRPRTDGAHGRSSGVVFRDAPWVLVIFSEASGLPSWDEVRRDGVRPNTKWACWWRLHYEGDELKASADAVTVGLHGYPRHWPPTAVKILHEHGKTFQAAAEVINGSVSGGGDGVIEAGVTEEWVGVSST